MIKLIFLSLLSWTGPAHLVDSLRTETVNGKVYVIHQVTGKETVYSLARRYGSDVTAIVDQNPKVANGLEVGQLVRIPYQLKSQQGPTGTSIHKVTGNETLFSIAIKYKVSVGDMKSWNKLKSNKLSPGQEIIIRKKAGTTTVREPVSGKLAATSHIVEPGETLFAISRKYGISVGQLKQWNDLKTNALKVGSVIIVGQSLEGKTETRVVQQQQPDVVKEERAVKDTPQQAKPIPVAKEIQKTDSKETIRISESVQGSDEIKEAGLAELIEGTEGNRKYLGLHRTAKVGTILKVKNEMNNREVFVRIVGPLPDTGVNDKVIIKISRSAYERLGAIDPRFRVEVIYYK